jgi:DNA-binding CsgD family transcriptional regulator
MVDHWSRRFAARWREVSKSGSVYSSSQTLQMQYIPQLSLTLPSVIFLSLFLAGKVVICCQQFAVRGEVMDSRIGLILLDSGNKLVYLCGTAAEILRAAARASSTITSDDLSLHVAALVERLDAVSPGASIDLAIGGNTYRLSQTIMTPLSNGHGRLVAIILEPVSDKADNLTAIARIYRLTRREQEVLALVLKGLSPKEIGGRLSISSNTAKAFVHALLTKTGASGRAELIAKLRDINQ